MDPIELLYECAGLTQSEAQRELGVVDFSYQGPGDEWHDFIPDPLKGVWQDLTLEVKTALYLMAISAVERENWDD